MLNKLSSLQNTVGMDRNETIKSLRPERNGSQRVNGDETTAYYNEVVLPIIEMQRTVILAFLQRWATRKSKHFELYKNAEKVRFLKVLIRENELINQGLIGLIHGVMTPAEIDTFFAHYDALEKKVMREVESLVDQYAVLM